MLTWHLEVIALINSLLPVSRYINTAFADKGSLKKKTYNQNIWAPWWIFSRARNESRILRVLLVSVPTCNRSLINHNRRVWQIKRIRSRRIIFHGDHQI